MIIIGATASIYARATAKPRHRVELLNASNGVDVGLPRETRFPAVNRTLHERPDACHFETCSHVGFIESRLSSAFVAQVLGQDLLTKSRDTTAGSRAYAQALNDAPIQRLLGLV